MTPINDYNFIRWYPGAGRNALNLTEPLPYPGIRQDFVQQVYHIECDVYKPVIAFNTQFSFFINSSANQFYSQNLLLYKVGVIQGDQWVNTTTLPGLQFYGTQTNQRKAWGNFILPPGIVRSGSTIQLAIIDGNDIIQFFSNPILAMDQETAERTTVPVAYSNSRNMYYYPYTEVGFFNQIRLHLYQTNITSVDQVSQYESVNTGRIRNYISNPHIDYTFSTAFFDADAHRAMIVMTKHDDIVISGRKYIPRDIYVTNMVENDTMSRGTWTATENEFSTINLYRGETENETNLLIREAEDQDIRVISPNVISQ